MPFTKVQVTMEILLYKIPQILRLYDEEDIYGDDKIDPPFVRRGGYLW